MGITYTHDKRVGVTYAYETTYVWNKEKKQSRSKRRLIGRVDPETGEVVPTDGRMRRAAERRAAEAAEREKADANAGADSSSERRFAALEAELRALSARVAELEARG